MNNEKELYEKFKNWLSNEITQEHLNDLAEKSEWYSCLLMFELNHMYQLWYNEEPSFMALPPKLQKYLFDNNRNYHNRLLSLETRTMLRRR
jgi:hypothetical protein